MEVEENNEFLLKFLIVGDHNVGKDEILSGLDIIGFSLRDVYKPMTTFIQIEDKRVKLKLCDISVQQYISWGLNKILLGAHGIIFVYDITNKQSFKGIDGWLKKVNEHSPCVPKFLIGNRLQLASVREVATKKAELYASRNNMVYFEISPLSEFNVRESFCDLAKIADQFNGMERIFFFKVLTLQELCSRTICKLTSFDDIDTLPLPPVIKSKVNSYRLKHCKTKNQTKQRNSICSIL